MDITGFARAASTYNAAATIQADIAAWLSESLPPALPRTDGMVLDIGCGTGRFTRTLQQRYPAATIIGLDAALPMLEQAQADTNSISLVAADAARLPLKPGSIDLITSNMALQWLEKPLEALHHWQSLLRPGGRMLVTLPVEGTFQEWHRQVHHHGGTPAFRFPPAALFRNSGLRPTERIFTRHYQDWQHFLHIVKKSGAFRPNQPYRRISGSIRQILRQPARTAPPSVSWHIILLDSHTAEPIFSLAKGNYLQY